MKTFDERLQHCFHQGISHGDLENAMYPHEQHPRYWKHASQGGPPGGRMSFHAALRRRGYWIEMGYPYKVFKK